MKTALIGSALAGAALASSPHHPRQLAPVDPATAPKKCRDAASSAAKDMPTEPAKLRDFSSSYYETASRTASDGGVECAWMTEVPEELYTEVTNYTDDLLEWWAGLKEEDVKEVEEACAGATGEVAASIGPSSPCQDESSALATKVQDGEFFFSFVLDIG